MLTDDLYEPFLLIAASVRAWHGLGGVVHALSMVPIPSLQEALRSRGGQPHVDLKASNRILARHLDSARTADAEVSSFQLLLTPLSRERQRGLVVTSRSRLSIRTTPDSFPDRRTVVDAGRSSKAE